MAPAPLYLISGLCADERKFRHLNLRHPHPVALKWIPPAPNDTMATYARKLIQQMQPHQAPPILVGLSFGGMMAQEIAKQIPVKRLILLSSLPDTRQLPWYYRLSGKLRLQKWLPLGLAKYWTAPGAWVFGAETQEDKALFEGIIKETDLFLLRWSLTQILQWRNEAPPVPAVIIHGEKDRILPVPPLKEVHLIKGGGHLVVLNRAQEVSAIINRYLD